MSPPHIVVGNKVLGGNVMFNLVLADSELETIPKEIWSHPSISRYCSRRRKKPRETILDSSYHYKALRHLEDGYRRGRPDIVHFSLLYALGTPLCKKRMLNIFVHTRRNLVIEVDPETRLPKHYNRFIGLMEQLFREKRVPPTGKPLLLLRRASLSDILKEKGDLTILIREGGEKLNPSKLISLAENGEKVNLVVGGFPHGDFISKFDFEMEFSVYEDPLEAWVVIGKVIHSIEEEMGIG